MRQLYPALLALLVSGGLARAHFIWIVPAADASHVQVIFSDSLQPDSPELLARIAHARLRVHQGGQATPVQWKKGENAYRLDLGQGPQTVLATCPYGVIQRGSAEPFLLIYTAKACCGPLAVAGPVKPMDADGLEIVPSGKREFIVFWKGKPLAGAEVVVLGPNEQSETTQSDARGAVSVGGKAGQYGLRAQHVEAVAGERDGKKYQQARHYATLVAHLAEEQPAAAPKPDPEATKLLAEARAARAQWQDFPGFAGDIEVNFDGQLHRGTVHVEANGKVMLDRLDPAAETWARRTLASVVTHRLDNSASRNTPCAFADDQRDHPLGRRIRVLNDELHSSYRIRDRQIMVVSREMEGSRFTISMQENRTNAEGKFLPISYVVNFWDAKTGQLQRSEAHFQSWTRVGPYDLPATVRVVTASSESAADKVPPLSARSLTLSNLKLLAGKP
jgi:hypothetical protein